LLAIAMEGETEGMPYDDRKDDFVKSYSKGKSKAMKRALRDAKNDFLIVKTVNAKDAKHLVDEEGCLRECLCAGVAYSMNRRQRWDRLSAKNVLSDVANTKTSIGVLENWNTAKRGENLASAYHEVRNGIMTTRKAHHLAANANTLIEKPKPKRRGSKAKRELAAAVEMGVDGEQTSTPKVTYTISRAHPSAAKWKIPTKKGPKVTVKKRVKPIYDDIVEEDDEREITDTEKEIDENEALIEGHPRSFDISEFVVQPPSREVVVKAPSIESLESTVASQSLTAPFELVTFPKEVREVSLSLALRIRVRRWHDFDFDKDAKELIASGQYPHTWLTHGDGVLALDLTQAVVGHSQSYPHLTAVFERPFNNIMSVHINGAFTLNISYEQVIAELFNSRPKSLVGFVTSLIQCAMDWNEEEFYHSLKQFAFPELRREDVITLAESHFYYRIYQSEMLAGTLSIVPFEKMAEEIEKDHESRTTRDDFESLENEWNEAVCSICRLALRAGLCKLGCLHGICTDCLRESITGQIRQGISPVKCHVSALLGFCKDCIGRY
uniref:RING-type domain-containing protein n=1 Tax=Toxocara canis TaxID=6265 RepID=A0A183U124_TOXCA